MDVRIGVTHAPKELNLEMDGEGDTVREEIEAAMGGGGTMLWLTDRRGTRVGIPVDKLAYIEIEGEGHRGQVGFGA